MKETMGQGPTHALVEPDPVQEAMALYFAQVVTQLGQGGPAGVFEQDVAFSSTVFS